MDTFVSNLKDFFATPFKGASQMNTGDWFLFIGFFLVVVIIWNIVFSHVIAGIEK